MTSSTDARLPVRNPRLAARYVESGAWTTRTTIDRFRSSAAQFADRDAVAGADGTKSYRELDQDSDRMAAGLVEAGLVPGTAVIVQVANSVEAVVAFYALLKAGAVPVAALAAHRRHEIAHVSAIVAPAGHLVDTAVSRGALVDLARRNAEDRPGVHLLLTVGPAPSGFVRLRDLGHEIPPDRARALVDEVQSRLHHEDVGVFQLSGGTTGTPKVIPRLHAEYWDNAVVNSAALERSATVRIAHTFPILHNAGVVNALFGAHAVGGCVVPLPFGEPGETLRLLLEHRVDDMMIGSAMADWFDHPLWEAVLDNAHALIYSGAKVPPALFEACSARGVWMGQTWGMAEGPYTSTPRRAPASLRATTVGSPVHRTDDEILIVDPATHEPLPQGTPGMLTYRGPSTLSGYFDAPEHDAAAFTEDGRLLTGDLARVVDHDGLPYLVLEGRIKDVISRGGEKISTEEVEKLLVQHPDITQAAVVAMPDARLGERACAFVVTTAGARLPLSSVQDHFASLDVAKFKWPERLETIGAMPLTPTYKIDKVLLRHRIAGLLGDPPQGRSGSEGEVA